MDEYIEFKIHQINDDTFDIEAVMGERIYLLIGRKKALVIDTGMGLGSLVKVIRSLTSLPLIIVNTHGHPDHAGGNYEFNQKVYLSKKDYSLYKKMVTTNYRSNDIKKIYGNSSIAQLYIDNLWPICDKLLPLEEGTNFELGERKVAVYSMAGHTKGSMVLFDEKYHGLFVGDAISLNDTWLYLDYSLGLSSYLVSLLTFKKRNLPINIIYSGHYPNVAKPNLIDDRIALLKEVISGEKIGKKTTTFAGTGLKVEGHNNSFIYDERRIKE